MAFSDLHLAFIDIRYTSAHYYLNQKRLNVTMGVIISLIRNGIGGVLVFFDLLLGSLYQIKTQSSSTTANS